ADEPEGESRNRYHHHHTDNTKSESATRRDGLPHPIEEADVYEAEHEREDAVLAEHAGEVEEGGHGGQHRAETDQQAEPGHDAATVAALPCLPKFPAIYFGKRRATSVPALWWSSRTHGDK